MTLSTLAPPEVEQPVLLTQGRWSERQALQSLRDNLTAFMGHLDPAEQHEYLRLCGEQVTRDQGLSDELNRFYSDVMQQSVDALDSALASKAGKPVNSRTTYLKTRIRQVPLPLDELPANDHLSSQIRIYKEDLSVREYERSITLLAAAQRNFGFTAYFSTEEQRASYISDDAISVNDFVAIARSLDIGKRINDYVSQAFSARLDTCLFGQQGTKLLLALYDAYRSREPWNISQQEFVDLKTRLFDDNTPWTLHQLDAGGEKIAMPFYTLQLQGSGVYSYFPDRPEGALRRHASLQEAVDSLQNQIRNDVGLAAFNWFMKAIDLNNQERIRTFIKPLAVNRDKLYWHARILYDLFASTTPNRQKLAVEQYRVDTRSLAHALPISRAWAIQSDLTRLARTNTVADREAAVALLTYLVSETLSMLLIPVPGGVTGLSRVMLYATLGTLAYQGIEAVSALRRGQQAELVQAVGDIFDLLVGVRLQGVAGRLSARRTRALMKSLGHPHHRINAEGQSALWLLDAYTDVDPKKLEGLEPNSQGLFEKDHRTYIQLQVDGQSKIASVTLEKASGRYRLTHEGARHLPYVTYSANHNRWTLDPIDTRALSEAKLLQHMLSPSEMSLTPTACQRALDASRINREGLLDIWYERQPIPPHLTQAVNDQQLREGLDPIPDVLPITLLRRRFPDLSHAMAADLLSRHASLRTAGLYATLEAPVREAIAKGQEQSIITQALGTLSDPNSRGLNEHSQTLFCNLLTLLPDWPSEVAIQIYQATLDTDGHMTGRGPLLETYGSENADTFVMLVTSGNRYAGYLEGSASLQMPEPGENSLVGAALRALNEAQRYELGQEVRDADSLAHAVIQQARVHHNALQDFVIPSRELPLSTQSLLHFRAFDLRNDPRTADADGLYRVNKRLYVNIENVGYQVMLDRDASSPDRQVLRIVKSADPVALDEGNVYNSSRSGETRAICRNAGNVWVGAVVGGAGGMRRSEQGWSFHRELAQQARALANRLRTPEARVRELFRSFTPEQVNAFIQSLGNEVGLKLAQREAELVTLKTQLKAWQRENMPLVGGAAQATTMAIERCWRRQSGTSLGVMPNSTTLPPLKADFSHVQTMSMNAVNWSEAADIFLSNFSGLKSLTITKSNLSSVPNGLGKMPGLTTLDLSSNHMVMDAQDARYLSLLSQLEHINLSDNPLGISTDFSAMAGLKTLNLRNTRIVTWPTGLQSQSGLTLVDLRNNRLREVPQVNLDPPADQLEAIARINGVTLLKSNAFPANYWQQFARYWNRLHQLRPDLVEGALADAFDVDNPRIDRFKRMYPNKSTQQARALIHAMGEGVDVELSRREREFDTLAHQLRAWSFSGGGERQRYVRANQRQANAETRGDRYTAQERILSCWRRETTQPLTAAGEHFGHELDLSGLRLPSLPDLDADFRHVGSLKLNDMNLSASPEGFLARYRGLRWLDMSNNQLRELPPALGEMHGLTRLFLQNNQIRLSVDTARTLSERVTLRALALTGNPIGITPDFSRITDLRALVLPSTGIDTWPTGLEHQPLLEVINLSDNQITTIPDRVISPPDDQLAQSARLNGVTNVSNNPLSAATLAQVTAYSERLRAIGLPAIGQPNTLVWSAQRISQGASPTQRPEAPFQRWAAGLPAQQVSLRKSQWNALQDQEGANSFFVLLSRLETGGPGHADLQRRVWEVIDTITENNLQSEKLRKEIFDRAGEPGCCDRAAFSFSNLEVISLIYSARSRATDQAQGAQLAQFSRGLFRLHEVDKFASADIQKSEAIDRDPDVPAAVKLPHTLRLQEEVEIRLAYRYGLKDRLQLPGQPQNVRHIQLGSVTQAMLETAYDAIIKLDNSPEEFQALVSREFWKSYVTNKHRAQFEAQSKPYQDQMAALYDRFTALELTPEAYKKLSDELEAQLAIEEATLIQTLTRQELAEQPPAPSAANEAAAM